ncbi:hypothetical protein AB0L13_33740 [Saccharopolyspora shandongensis]|uniref:hypothetical protein n=1 Tax=Saccharopolyspora shandongensis TaxID=418495 RepID=UPI003417ED3B
MKSGPQIALAIAIGYVLGRSRKMKLAIATAGVMAGRRLGVNPKDLLAQGGKAIVGSPELKKLTGEARERLMDAAKAAAIAAATNKIDSIGDNLTKRAAGLRASNVGAQASGLGEQAAGLGKRASGLGKRTAEETPEEYVDEGEAATEEQEEERAAVPSPRSTDHARGRPDERSASARASTRRSEPSGRKGSSTGQEEPESRSKATERARSTASSGASAAGRLSGRAGSRTGSGTSTQHKSGTSSKSSTTKKSS